MINQIANLFLTEHMANPNNSDPSQFPRVSEMN